MPVTHAMDPASPARPMGALAAVPQSAVGPAPMQSRPATAARPGPGPSGAASTQPNQAGQGCLGEFRWFGSQSFGRCTKKRLSHSVYSMMAHVYARSVWF